MAAVGNKRKAACPIGEPSKRIRIEPASTYENTETVCFDDNDDLHSNYGVDEDSEDDQSQTADTPLTPFSPSRKFPSELKTIKCTYEGCTKTFNRPARLASHLRSHTNERPFVCTYVGCDKAYMEEKHLKQHIKGSHTHEKSYQCDWYGCSKSFLTATRLRRHREAHEGHERFRCTAYPPCNQTFRKHQTLQRHIRAAHLELYPFPCTQVDSGTGAICNAGFDSAGALRKHEDRVHGALRFWCDECSSIPPTGRQRPQQQFGFRTKTELAKHIRTEHSNCIFCDLRCSNQTELLKHIDREHSTHGGVERNLNAPEAEKIPCTYPGCFKIFTKKYNLGVHIRSVHNGERFVCSPSSMTSSTFKSPEVATWDGGNACGKDFVSKANLEDHIRTQHLGLPSVVNAKRIKGASSGGRKRKKARNGDDDMEAINFLTGVGYGRDDARDIPCLVAGCPWLFTRQYDLNLHVKTKHTASLSESEEKDETLIARSHSRPEIDDPNDREALDELYHQAGIEWELQGNATSESTPFWVGADTADAPEGESWSKDEEEMRRLIDEVGFDDFVDPALRDI